MGTIRPDSDCIRAVDEASRDEHPDSELDPVESRRQTASKLNVLRNYYRAWPNAILQGLRKASSRPIPADLWIIDLFAGKGTHGSAEAPGGQLPGTPSMAAFRLWQALTLPENAHVTGHLVAIDADPGFETPLHDSLNRFEIQGRLEMRIQVANCARVIDDLRQETVDGYTLWLFDPYGLRSIPFELFAPLHGSQPKTEVLVNLDAGGMRRAIDGVMKQQGHDLQLVNLPALDCLFGDRAWRGLPPQLTSTGDRERWLVDRYVERHSARARLAEQWPLEGGADFRALIQFADHPTAIATFRRHYEQTTKLWKRPRPGPTTEALARALIAELSDQPPLTPRLIHSLGILPAEIPLSRVDQACDHAMQLGLADRKGTGADADVEFHSVRRGLFDD